jgi:hypothetical protein
MSRRLVRRVVLVGSLLVLVSSIVHAQSALVGELHAAEVSGYVVIACAPHPIDGCDEARSGFTVIDAAGARAQWRIDGLDAGPFLVLAWRDTDGDGEAQDHEFTLLTDADGEPSLVTPPATALLIRSADAPTTAATAPAASATPVTGAAALAIPEELVGIWQQTSAAAGDYRDVVTGSTFSMTSGFSALLKLRADGSYLFQLYSSGVAPDCGFVSSLDTSTGTASFEQGALVLWPDQRVIENQRCDRSATHTLGPEPIVLSARLTEGFDADHHRTWRLELDGAPIPLSVTLLHRPPAAQPPRPPLPVDFVAGATPPLEGMRGVWSSHHHSDLGFFDPSSNAWYLPEFNGAKHLWVRFWGDGYDLARAWRNYAFGQGVCGKDYVYYERGRADLAVLQDLGEGGYAGHGRFGAVDARLIVNIRDCGSDTGATVYTLTPQTSYYAWTYRPASTWLATLPATLSLQCPWAMSEWQFMVCDGSSAYGASLTPR